jgi:hypothetical protein
MCLAGAFVEESFGDVICILLFCVSTDVVWTLEKRINSRLGAPFLSE